MPKSVGEKIVGALYAPFYVRCFALAALLLAYPFAAATAQPAQEATAVATIEEAFAWVYRDNPFLIGRRHALRTTQELYPQAVAGWHPWLDAEAGVTRHWSETSPSARHDNTTGKNAFIGIDQPLYRGGRTVAETGAAENRIHAARHRLAQAEQDIFMDVVRVYADLFHARTVLSYQEMNQEALGRQRDSLQARYEEGDLTLTDLRRAEARLSEAEAGVIRARGDIETAQARFEEVVGRAPAPTIAQAAAPFDFPETAAEMMALAETRNPRLFVVDYDHRAAQYDIDSAESERLPQLNAFASHSRFYDPPPGILDHSHDSALGLRARINLYQGGRTMSRIREAKSRANQRHVESVQERRAVRSEVIENWSRMRAFTAEIAARRLEVAAAEYAAQGVREEARLGERTTIETLDAEQDLLRARTALADAQRNHIVAAYALAAGAGLLRPASLGLGDETDMAGRESIPYRRVEYLWEDEPAPLP